MMRLRNYFRGRIGVRWQKFLPRLVMLEKYESLVKWLLRGSAAIGLASSFVVFESTMAAFGAALLLLGLEQILERTVFQYTTLYLQPFPNFTYKSSEWLGLGFIVFHGPESPPNTVILAFRTEEYASKFWELVRAWNYDEDDDPGRNVCLSFVWEDGGRYFAFLYANPARPSVLRAKAEAEEELRLEKFGKEHMQLVFQMVICKEFEDRGSLREFIVSQELSPRPFQLAAGFQGQRGIAPVPSLKYLRLHHLRVLHADDLKESDFEYRFRHARSEAR